MDRVRPHHLLALAAALGVAAFALSRLLPGGLPGVAGAALYGTALMLAFAALLRGGLPDACESAPTALRRRYTRELFAAMAVYVLLLLVSVWLLRHVELEGGLRAAVALLPVPPIALALRAMVRYIRDVDEMQQRIELEAVSIATAFVCLLYMTGGFLQAARVIDIPASAALIWLFPLVCFSYGLAKVLVNRRYR